MIENFNQYRVTYDTLKEFEKAIQELAQDPNVHPLLFQAQREAIKSEINKLEKSLNDFEARCKLKPIEQLNLINHDNI